MSLPLGQGHRCFLWRFCRHLVYMSSNEPEKKTSSPWRLPLWFVLLLLCLLGVAVFGDKGVLRALQARSQRDALLEDIRRLEAENTTLRHEIESLRSDRRYIEGIARKDLGMVKDDELVYQFPQEKPKKEATPPAPQMPPEE